MLRVAAGELPPTLRLARPARAIAFSKRDAVTPGFREAASRARELGFEPIVRLAGGRAAVYHEGTMELAHARRDPDPQKGIHERFAATAELLAAALRAVGADARVGEVPGEWCPGRYSVNARGAVKLAGLGQRIVAGGSHTGAVVVVSGVSSLAAALGPVYQALGVSWEPATAGAVASEAGLGSEDGWLRTRDALVAEYARRNDVEPADLDKDTLALARRLAAEHRAA
ncbi:MAG TPA: hypothetical protein VK307_07565 [Thermoleophilaceae bacterium]|nr:hypothetical protein [Thermoleophilaceae bacterium]